MSTLQIPKFKEINLLKVTGLANSAVVQIVCFNIKAFALFTKAYSLCKLPLWQIHFLYEKIRSGS